MKKKVIDFLYIFSLRFNYNRRATWIKTGKIVMEKMFRVTIKYSIIGDNNFTENKKEEYIYRAERPLDILMKMTQGHVLGWKKLRKGCFMHPQKHLWSWELDESLGLGKKNFWKLEIIPVEEVIIDA